MRKGPEVLTTSRTYPLSFMTQIFHNDQPSDGGDDFSITNGNIWFSSFLVSSHPLSMVSWFEPRALEFRINWEIYTLYAGAANYSMDAQIKHFFLSWNLQNKYEFMESIRNWKRSSSSDNICNERVVLTCCRIGYAK